jgi:DNA processing protein
MDQLHQLLTLDLLPGIGCYRLLKKLRGLSPFELFDCSDIELIALGFNAQHRAVILAPDLPTLNRAMSWLERGDDRQIVSYFDPQYPSLLKHISSPPLLLFCQGEIRLLETSQIAIVGSRAPTIVARETARHLANELVGAGLTITSGLATGIDSCAHIGAISARGATIAVLGSGLDNIYPKSNMGLAKKITERGLLISEFWPDVPPKAPHFPRRNRIVSGLSLGVVVVEAAEKSGSLITARLAVEQNREVFAVPGSINNPKVQGCHKLINQGAKLVAVAADILEELPAGSFFEATHEHKKFSRLSPQSLLPFDVILDSVGYEATSIDQVVERSNIAIDVVLQQLLSLELAGLIVLGSGGYIRVSGGG